MIEEVNMKEINEEIILTLNLMQFNNCEGVLKELQYHLNGLLEIKRNEYKQRLVERSWADNPAPYKSVKLDGQIADEAKPLTPDELKAGGWWCADTSADALKAFILYGLEAGVDIPWDGSYYACFLYVDGSNLLDRGYEDHTDGLKQIHRIGNKFYWSDK